VAVGVCLVARVDGLDDDDLQVSRVSTWPSVPIAQPSQSIPATA
jgi:hypothetical protein